MGAATRFAGYALLGTLAAGCSVSLAEEPSKAEPSPLCESDDECSEDATCEDGYCVGGSTIFDTMLFEVSVPNSPAAGDYAGGTFLRTLTDLPREGGTLDLDLAAPVPVELTVVPPHCETPEGESADRVDGACPNGSSPASEASCERYDFGLTPLEVILTPKERALGLSTVRYTKTSTCLDDGCGAATISLTVPPGEYDGYLRVDPTAEVGSNACPVVPQIFNLEVPANVQFKAPFELDEPARFDLEVQWPLVGNGGAQLVGWLVDMLDSVSARRISTEVALEPPATDGDYARYLVSLSYISPSEGTRGSELVRLRPPEGEIGPTIVMDRSGLQLFEGPALIDSIDALPHSVEVEVQILARTNADDPSHLESVGGIVTLVATKLEVPAPEVPASFRQTVEVSADDEGIFRVALLPGTYRVRVVPPSDCSTVIPCPSSVPSCPCPLAATEVTDFAVAAAPSFQAGKTIELEWRTRLTGQVSSASGTAVEGVDVSAVPAPTRPAGVELAFGEAFVPRTSSTRSLAGGGFELLVDAGSFNVSVRPSVETSQAWLVRPNVPVVAGDGSLDLQGLVMPLPVSYAGALRAPAPGETFWAVPNAVIRAYVPLEASNPASTVVQVAEAHTDAEGGFQLLLPATLEHTR